MRMCNVCFSVPSFIEYPTECTRNTSCGDFLVHIPQIYGDEQGRVIPFCRYYADPSVLFFYKRIQLNTCAHVLWSCSYAWLARKPRVCVGIRCYAFLRRVFPVLRCFNRHRFHCSSAHSHCARHHVSCHIANHPCQ